MKNHSYFFFAFLFIISSVNAQGVRYGSKVTLQGKIIDATTQKPVSFANIGFVEKSVGTVSDGDGNYTLEFAPALLDATDRLQFSVIGYKTRIFSKNESLLGTSKPFNIFLDPEPYSLDEVIVGESKRRKSTIGDLDYDERIIGYWKDIEGLGGEILTKVKVRSKNTKLHNLKFKVLENGSDSLLVRVNVYDVDRGVVGRNLLKESINYTIDAKSGLVSIPLEKYGIYVHENIIVGIELLKIYGSQIGFSLAGSRSEGISFVRYKSQDRYKPVEKTTMAFELDMSTPDKNGNSVDERDLSNHIIVYWDSSASTDHRDINKELEIIASLLNKTKEAQVDVIKFSMTASEEKTFYMHRGKSKDIIEYLKSSEYNSIGHIEALPRPELRDNTAILLVTAGQTMVSDITPDFPAPVFVITTSKEANLEDLEKLAVYSDGDILDGSKETVKELLKRYTHFIDEAPIEKFPKTLASGSVSFKQGDSLVALQGVTVSVQDSYRTTSTDNLGNYRIAATTDDILSMRFPGMKEKEVKVSSRDKNNVLLEPTVEMLDQVIIVGKKEEETLVNTSTGMRNEDAVGYKNTNIQGEEIFARHTTLGQILRRRSEIQVLYDPFTRKEIFIFPRTYYASIRNPQSPIIIIDGLIYKQDSITVIPQIDTQTIKSINVSSSLAAGNRYGSIAAGGVIDIKTINGNPDFSEKKEKPSALVQGNDYEDIGIVLLGSIEQSDVQKRLAIGANIADSKEIYFNLLKSRTNAGIEFYMEAFDFFKDENPQFAKEAVTSMIAKAPQNPQVLRTVAYALGELEEYELTAHLYEHILKIAPRDIQSYRDLANAHLDTGNYKESFELYKTILANSSDGIDFKPLQETAENELKRLITFHKSEVSFSDLPNELLVGELNKDQRLVFEWNDPSIQFELQFVNPERKFFTWDHTIYKNQEKVVEGIKNGMMIQEFELDNLSEGEWLINLSYLSENTNSKESPYLKYTLYSDYGTSLEKKETKIISLSQMGQKTTIDRININQSNYEN